MDEYRENVKKVQKALNQDAAFIQPNPYLAQRVLNAKRKQGGGIRMRKRNAVVLLLIVLLTTAVTACAVVRYYYFTEVASFEGAYGKYENWPDDKKVSLVNAMYEAGFTIDSTKVHAMNDAVNGNNAGDMADQIIFAYFNDRTTIDTFNVMLHELGRFESWSVEDKGLYSSLLIDHGLQQDDWPIYMTPESTDIQEDNAISLAQNTISTKFGIDLVRDNVLVYTMFILSPWEYGEEPVWIVEFSTNSEYADLYRVVLSRNGDVISYKAPQSITYFPVNTSDYNNANYADEQNPNISETQAIEICNDLLSQTDDLPCASEKLTVEANFIMHEDYNNGNEPVWLCYVKHNGTIISKILLAYNGDFIDMVKPNQEFSCVKHQTPLLQIRFGDFNFHNMSLEEKVAFSAEWNPVVEAYIEENPYYPNYNTLLYRATRNVFGLPGEDHLTQEQALDIAISEIRALGANEATLDLREVRYSFVVTDPERPYWVIYFYPPYTEEGYDVGEIDTYRVKICAITGEVLSAYNATGVVTNEVY